MTSDQQYLAIEVTIATNYVISFLYNKLPRRRVDVFADELSAALHKKLAAEGQSTLSQRTVRIAISPPLDIDGVVTDAIRSSGLTVEEVVQELPLALAVYIEAGEVAYSIGSNHNAEPIPIYSTRRVLSEGGALNSQGAFLNPSVDAVGLLDGVDPNLLALLSIRPIGNNSSAAVPTAVFAQTKFGSTKFRSQNSGSARRPSRLNGGSASNGPQAQNGSNGGNDTPINHGPRSNASTGSTSSVRSSNPNTPNGWPQPSLSSQAPPQSGIISPTSRFQQNENIFSSAPLPPVVTSAAAAVLGNSTVASCGSGISSSSNGRQGNGNYRTPSANDFAYLLQDLQGSGSSISSPALSEFAPSLTSSFDGNLLRSSNGHSMNGMSNGNSQRHSYHGNGNNSNGNNIPSLSSSTSGGFFPSNASSSTSSSAIGSLLFDSGIVSPSSWSSSTPVSSSSAASRAAEKLAAVQQHNNSTFSDHSNSSSTSSSGSLSLFNGSLNSGHCGADSWGLGGSNGLNGSSNGGSNVFSDTNAALTGTSHWAQSLRMAAGPSGWDQLTVSES